MTPTIHRGWIGSRPRLARQVDQASVQMLLEWMGIDIRARRRGRGKPCEQPDCPRRAVCEKPLFERPQHEILDVLARARANYLRRMKEVHPDAGGTAEEAALLTRAWERIHRIFARHKITLP